MARILSPFLSQDARGSIGTLTASRIHSGQVLHLRSRPLDKRSPNATVLQRDAFAYLVYSFTRLSSSVLAQWQRLADITNRSSVFGARKPLTPKDIYLSLNLTRIFAGYDKNDIAPWTCLPSYRPTFTIAYTSSKVQLSWTPALSTYDFIVVYQKRNLRASSISPAKTTFSEIIRYGTTSPYFITPSVDNGSGPGNQPPFTSGSTMHIHVFASDAEGRRTVKQFFSVLCS